MESHKWISFETLRDQYGSFLFDFWRHRQLADFIALQCHASQIRSTLTNFESLWAAKDSLTHMISVLYKLLAVAKPKPFFVREWECDLWCGFTDEQLHHLCHLTHSSSVDCKTQENNYKLLWRWYPVPGSLAKIYPSTSDLCWRGCGQRGTFLHIWWVFMQASLPFLWRGQRTCPGRSNIWDSGGLYICYVVLAFLTVIINVIYWSCDWR